MKSSLVGGLILILLMSGCRGDNRERLFDMVYPNIRFEIPAGLGGLLPRVFEIENFATGIKGYLGEGVDTTTITGIRPASATLTILDSGADFRFLREVSVRICTTGSPECRAGEEVFYLDDLANRRVGNELKLIPTLINARRLLIRDRVKVEVLFYLQDITPQTLSARLDMRFEAVR
ncbi:MAG: hypothetical protein H6555_06295 [Lewinellaceae bacterium]|nr:hypothetical protein [Lewinellaceae bacterium]